MHLQKLIRVAPVVGVLCLTGCDRGKVVSYDIPKETPPAPTIAMHGSDANPHMGMDISRPSVHWGEVPSGWTEVAQTSGMRLASFSITGGSGESAEMAIIPMGGFAGTDQQLVNMWRMQLGLPELGVADTGELGQPITVGGVQGQLYEMAGQAQEVDTRILVASVNKDNVHYFFKLIGHNATVSAQKEAFLNFLKTVEFSAAAPAAAAPAMAMPAASPSSAGQPWTALTGWEELPATQFLLAKYRVPGAGGENAEVTVSKLGGSAGGLLPNVNRWRGQLNLGPVDEAGLNALLSDIKAGSVDAQLVELDGTDLRSGTASRMLVVTVSLPAETWFFKMTGPVSVMDAKAAEFRTFVNNARF